MKPLICDFEHAQRPGPASWLLLAAGIAATFAALAAYQGVERENQAYLQALRQAEPKPLAAKSTRSDDDVQVAAAFEAARRTAQQIGLPWNDLFVALESASHSDIAILSLAPDSRRGEVRIAAEARSMTAMLAYHRRLEASGQLRDITLTDHEVVAQDPMHPVRFNVVGTWVKTNAHP
jgi:hypothetical protein